MSVAEELHEHAEHASAPFDKRVAATMAMIAAALAVVAVFGHLATTEELLNQQKASDQWAFYQAKSIRRYESQIARDVLTAMKAEHTEDYAKNLERYEKEGDDIQKEAKEFEQESHTAGRRALRLHFGEVFLEIAIVLASLAILTKRELLWITALVGAVAGIAISLTTLMVH
jgi:hypothetical protein